MNNTHFLLSAAVLATGFAFPAHAHSWYPKACCSQQDCMPADSIETDARGDMVVVAGSHRVPAPRHFTPMPSPDGRIHICFSFVFDEFERNGIPLPFCLFLPAQS
jgi:hypothetical protein